jgi:alanine racemase
LEFHKVNYLAVAYADEGVALRKAGIGLPIMVMSPDEQSFDDLINYHLEPELFSFPIYLAFHLYLLKQAISNFPIHIKLNTGMNRLGFELADVPNIASSIIQHQTMQVKSVFSHFVASESNIFDDFTLEQANNFSNACKQFQEIVGYTFIKHISNTAAIFRYPSLQYNMVRLGIGLYGEDSANAKELQLQTVATLKSTIAQIRTVKAGNTVGYGRIGLVQDDSQIATVRIGYADGFNRRLGNGRASMYVKGQLAPVVGNVCMDMTMIDVSGIPNLKEGDTVEVFGANLPVQQVADWSDTIVYEILTSISQRVKRVYLEE